MAHRPEFRYKHEIAAGEEQQRRRAEMAERERDLLAGIQVEALTRAYGQQVTEDRVR